jgi:glycosyltransferase involved in cell wall biosynthesis
MHADSLRQQDIIHDFSITKQISDILFAEGKRNLLATPLAGVWIYPVSRYNFTCFTRAMLDRGLRGATDYEGTPTPEAGGEPQNAIIEGRIVNLGIDTDWYTPTYDKKEFFLWMNRWHPAKGYKQAIELAKETGIDLVMAGEHPDNEMFEYQRNCVHEAINLATNCPNIHFEWLPRDPKHHEAKRELYRQAKALIYTVQFQEPFGLSQVESLACGTPVIGTNYGSVPEVITNGITGYVCKNDIKDFAIATKMIHNIKPELCREHAVMRFDRRIMAKAFLAEYEAILHGRQWGLS